MIAFAPCSISASPGVIKQLAYCGVLPETYFSSDAERGPAVTPSLTVAQLIHVGVNTRHFLRAGEATSAYTGRGKKRNSS